MDNKNNDIFSSENYLGLKGIKKNSIISNKRPPDENDRQLKLSVNLNNGNNEIDVGSDALKTEIITTESNIELGVNTSDIISGPKEKPADALQDIPLINNLQTSTMQTNVKDTTHTTDNANNKTNNSSLSKLNSYLKNFKILKFFNSKNSKVALLVVVLSIALILFLNLSTDSNNLLKASTTNFNSLEYVSSSKYISNMESKLTEVLSKIKDAGNVNVMITLESGPELKVATSVDERTNTSSSSSTSTTSVTVVENPIIITQNGQSQPLVLMEIMPTIKGVIIVAQGAGNPRVKLELLEAIQALLGITGSKVQIYAGI